jgi:hypothetical protein
VKTINQNVMPRVSVSVERESIPVQSMHPAKVPDPKWRYVDKTGHGHFWEGDDLPTLKWVVTGTAVAGDEYEMYEYEVGEYRCQICDEVIEPGKKLDYGPTHVPGPVTVTVEIDRKVFVLTEEMFSESIDRWREALEAITR